MNCLRRVYSLWCEHQAKKMLEKLELQTIRDSRGNLTVLERLPFEIKRVYWLYGVSGKRGSHAHKTQHRLMVAVSGGFRVNLCHGWEWSNTVLDSPSQALVLDPMVWVEVDEFLPNSVCLVFASAEHDEKDVIRDFRQFTRAKR